MTLHRAAFSDLSTVFKSKSKRRGRRLPWAKTQALLHRYAQGYSARLAAEEEKVNRNTAAAVFRQITAFKSKLPLIIDEKEHMLSFYQAELEKYRSALEVLRDAAASREVRPRITKRGW